METSRPPTSPSARTRRCVRSPCMAPARRRRRWPRCSGSGRTGSTSSSRAPSITRAPGSCRPTCARRSPARSRAIESGRQPPVLTVGNVDPVRDVGDVRDVAGGYVALLERGRRGTVYNLCTGEGASVAEIIAQLRSLARVPMRAWIDPARRRPHDAERIVGSHARATADTGWAPRIPLVDTLATVLDDWRHTGGLGYPLRAVHGAPAPHSRADPARPGARQPGGSAQGPEAPAGARRADRAPAARPGLHLRGGPAAAPGRLPRGDVGRRDATSPASRCRSAS